MSPDKMRMLEAFMRLNQLKVGDMIDDRLEADLRLVTGPRHEPQVLASIRFDKAGNAHCLENDAIKSVEMDGRDILIRPKGEV